MEEGDGGEVEAIRDDGLHLNLEEPAPSRHSLGYLVIIPNRGIRQAVCLEVQPFFVAMIFGKDELFCLVLLVSFLVSPLN